MSTSAPLTFGGSFTATLDVAWHSYLPVVVERRHLVEGNAKMQR